MKSNIIYLATSNEHKVQEFSEMMSGLNFQLKSAKELGGMPEVDECENTFLGNAFIKARALKKLAPKDAYIMADDSGLSVDALGGAPGVHSARYAGVKGALADKANNEKLLKELSDVPDSKRTARFICDIALICPDGTEKFFEGKVEGIVNHGEKGKNGFGYDPLFYVEEFGKTTAEIESAEKHLISHRGKAFKKLMEFLKSCK